MYTLERNSPMTHIVAPFDPKVLCTSCSTVMPSDICFNCGNLSKFLAAYPESETSVKADQGSTGLSNTCSMNFSKGYTRDRRERKLEHRTNKLLVKQNAMNWQFNLDGGLRDIGLHDPSDSQEYFGVEAEDIQIYYDVWRDLAQEEPAPLDDDLNLHYLGHNLMASLDRCAENHFLTDIEEDAKAENPEDEDEKANDADDEDSAYGDAQDSDGSCFPSNKLVEVARRCITMTMQWEASLPVERVSRKAQALYNDLCAWDFTDATSCAVLGATLIDEDELSPLTSARKFSFDDGYELDRQTIDSMDWDGNSDCSSSATVRNQLIECRHVVGGQAYEWDILL